jgi:hypothetical protein
MTSFFKVNESTGPTSSRSGKKTEKLVIPAFDDLLSFAGVISVVGFENDFRRSRC